MSLVTGALSSSKMLGLEDCGEIAEKGAILMGKEGEEEQKRVNGHDSEEAGEEERLDRQMSEMSIYGTEEEEEDEEGKGAKGIELGPRVSLKTEIEKDKDDDSLRRWKEQLLGSVDLNSVGDELVVLDLSQNQLSFELCLSCTFFLPLHIPLSFHKIQKMIHILMTENKIIFLVLFGIQSCLYMLSFLSATEVLRYATCIVPSCYFGWHGVPSSQFIDLFFLENLEPEVKILSLSILSPGRPDIVLPLPVVPNSKGVWFTLKEGSHYRLKFAFAVSNNIVSGLRYTNTVWKTGVKVERTKEMLGTFSPQPEPYTYETPEETTPSGLFARGSYSARTKFVDDDGKCYLEINYSFDIRREWPSTG